MSDTILNEIEIDTDSTGYFSFITYKETEITQKLRLVYNLMC